MQYVTGVQALNIPCSLRTSGDWHQSALTWTRLNLADSQKSIYKNYGIEGPKIVPEHKEKVYVANHLRALLDMLYAKDFSNAKGMRKDYICNDNYNEELFRQIIKMKPLSYWPQIDKFMEKEYLMKWLNFKKEYHV